MGGIISRRAPALANSRRFPVQPDRRVTPSESKPEMPQTDSSRKPESGLLKVLMVGVLRADWNWLVR